MRRLSGLRIARSFVTPTGAANEVERELDFQLPADNGIAIEWVLGYGQFYDNTPAVSDTVPAHAFAHQTIHLETGATEDVGDNEGSDQTDIDSEVIYIQSYATMFIVGATNTFGAGGNVVITPTDVVRYDPPIASPRNIIHKGTTVEADSFLNAGILMGYHYVEFSNAELGVLLARR